MTSAGSADLLVVGTGLIGTSIGLAARRAGRSVWLSDVDRDHVRVAASLGAGAPLDPTTARIGMVIVAAPPSVVATLCAQSLRAHPDAIVTHTASVQSQPQAEVESLTQDLGRFVGGHPVAGREVSGPAAAAPDLFVDRPWVLTPTSRTDPGATEAVAELARQCGARPVVLRADEHDEVFARVSHVPQLVASALAGALAGLDADAAALAGSGIRDTTRLADSDPHLWSQIATGNADAVAAGLRDVVASLMEVATALEDGADTGAAAVDRLVRRGHAGRALLPGKHGGAAVALSTVDCMIPDSPGALARLFTDIASAQINVEDLRVEHAPGAPAGVARVAVRPDERDRLLAALRVAGWTAAAGAGETL